MNDESKQIVAELKEIKYLLQLLVSLQLRNFALPQKDIAKKLHIAKKSVNNFLKGIENSK